MENGFWIGEKRMEIFKLWLASEITLFSNRADDMYWANKAKDVLNSLGSAYLNEQADTWYGVFVNNLIDSIN